ncbi:hypothetical protein GCM10023197_32620 [Gordonia humi]
MSSVAVSLNSFHVIDDDLLPEIPSLPATIWRVTYNWVLAGVVPWLEMMGCRQPIKTVVTPGMSEPPVRLAPTDCFPDIDLGTQLA